MISTKMISPRIEKFAVKSNTYLGDFEYHHHISNKSKIASLMDQYLSTNCNAICVVMIQKMQYEKLETFEAVLSIASNLTNRNLTSESSTVYMVGRYAILQPQN